MPIHPLRRWKTASLDVATTGTARFSRTTRGAETAARVDGACREVVERVVRHHEIVLSAPILSECEDVAGRPGQAPNRDTLRLVIREIARLAVMVEPEDLVFGLRDPDDEVYLATAAAGGAILITGNRRDFTEPRYVPVEAWSPRAFLDRTA